jgi:hypothetical protein
MGKILCHIFGQRTIDAARNSCADEEMLARYQTGLLESEEITEIEAHLGDCAVCRDDLVATHVATKDGETEVVPQRVLERAKALVPSSSDEPGFFDLVVRLVRDSLELVSSSGQLVPTPVLADIRGKGKSDAAILQVEKELGKIKVDVEVERLDGELCQVAVKVKPRSGMIPDALRLTLISGEREQASYLAPQGTAIFDRIAPGEYRLEISQAGRPMGSVRLKLIDFR